MKRWHLPDVEVFDINVDDVTPRRDDADVLTVEGLEVRYGRRIAIHDVTLHVRAGEVVAIIGHNGCGKTSTLRAIAGLVQPECGVVVIQPGAGTDHVGTNGATLRYVPTSRPVFGELSVRDNLWLGAGRMAAAARAARVDDVLLLFPELAGRLQSRAGLLSGGEQRLVSFGIALMVQPCLLLVDEPTQFLGPAATGRVLATIRRLSVEHGVGVLMAETSVAAAARSADRAYVMNSGAIRSEHPGADLRAAGPISWWRLL